MRGEWAGAAPALPPIAARSPSDLDDDESGHGGRVAFPMVRDRFSTPFIVGCQVSVLRGPHRGRVGVLLEIMPGQKLRAMAEEDEEDEAAEAVVPMDCCSAVQRRVRER